MADTREAILKHLAKLAAKIDGIDETQRMMRDFVNTEEGAAIVVFDGSEQRAATGASDGPRDGRASAVFAMRPELHVFLQATPGDAGKALNKIRASAISIVVLDEDLRALAGPNGWVRYLGCDTSAERGRAVEADMSLVFEIGYVVSPLKLAGD